MRIAILLKQKTPSQAQTMAADTALFSTTLLNENEPEPLEDSSDAIPEGKPESTQLRINLRYLYRM